MDFPFKYHSNLLCHVAVGVILIFGTANYTDVLYSLIQLTFIDCVIITPSLYR